MDFRWNPMAQVSRQDIVLFSCMCRASRREGKIIVWDFSLGVKQQYINLNSKARRRRELLCLDCEPRRCSCTKKKLDILWTLVSTIFMLMTLIVLLSLNYFKIDANVTELWHIGETVVSGVNLPLPLVKPDLSGQTNSVLPERNLNVIFMFSAFKILLKTVLFMKTFRFTQYLLNYRSEGFVTNLIITSISSGLFLSRLNQIGIL